MDNIFFAYILNGAGIPEKVFVFGGGDTSTELFSETQHEYFESENIDIVALEQLIYKEDPVSTIRRKIAQELKQSGEMYMFTETKVDTRRLWSSMYTPDKTRQLQHMLSVGIAKPVADTYAAWMALLPQNQEDGSKTVFTPLGFRGGSQTANPFFVLDEPDSSSPPLESAMQEPFLRFNTTSTNIYVCLKKSVAEYARKNNLPALPSLYFPAIPRMKADPYVDLRDEVHRWAAKNNVDRPRAVLENVKCTWDTDQDGIPIEAIFKRFHATDEFPRITWTRPGSEPLVRFLKSSAVATTSPVLDNNNKQNAIHFHESGDRMWSLYGNGRMTLTMARATAGSGHPPVLQMSSRLIQEINVVLHTLGLNNLRYSVMTSCAFSYVIPPMPMKVRPGPCLNYLRNEFGLTIEKGGALRLRRVDLLEYIPVLDMYLDYLLSGAESRPTTTTTSSFWNAEEVEPDQVIEDDDDDNDDDKTVLMRRQHGKLDVYEAPRLGGGSNNGSMKDLLGSNWQPSAAAPTTFLGAMAFLYAHVRQIKPVPSEKEFREILVQALTLDRFLKSHNGNLPALFPSNKEVDDHVDLDDPLLTSSQFVKSLNKNDSHQLNLLHQVVGSYNRFKAHIRDSKDVDYTHLWDLVCDVNPELLPRGINLVMIQEGHGRLQFICPSNAYSSLTRLDPAKDTAMVLLNKDLQYIPLQSPEGQITVRTASLSPQVAALAKQCRPQPSLAPDVYAFRASVTATDMQTALTNRATIVDQIVENEKTVALRVRGLDASQQPLFLPCLPSAILDNVPTTTTMEQAQAQLLSYTVTRDRLSGLAYATSNQIPCKPRYKVVSNNTYLGIVTEANEFVPTLQSAVMADSDDLETRDRNPTMKEGDDDTTSVALRLEGQFYDLYRGLVRMLLEEDTRQEWLRQIQSVTVSYENKLKFVESELKKLTRDHVHFQVMDAKMMKDVYDMVACDAAAGGEAPYCLTTGNGSVQTLFPRFNLVDPTINNETMYALRMADEMVRSRRLIPSTVGTPPTDYNLNDDEVVLAQSQLATYKNNPENTVWDTAKPSLQEEDSAGAADAAKMVQDCILKSNGRFTSPWKTVFPKKTTEIVFKKSCTFTPLMFLAKLHSQSAAPMTESAVRRVLWKAYKSLFDQHQPVLLELLNTTTPEQVEERVLRSTTYQLSDVDWWAFCQHLHIPAFLIWSDPLPANWLRLYTDKTANTAFWFIRKERGGKYSIVSTAAYPLSALTLSTLKDDQGRLILQQI